MHRAIEVRRSRRLLGGLAAFLLAIASVTAKAEEPLAETGSPASDAVKFCVNIADAARDARFAWEAKTLTDLKAEVEAATATLDSKRAELQAVISRREEFRKLAEQSVIDIYAKMRPEAAAAQLAALDERTAAAVLTKLNSRTASAILGEMDTPRAVSLAQLISSGGEADASVSQQ